LCGWAMGGFGGPSALLGALVAFTNVFAQFLKHERLTERT
jgi:hypothetical protein